MENEQIGQEISDLHDHTIRLEASIEDLMQQVQHIEERSLPASVAQVNHTLSGATILMCDIAGTAEKLALQLASITDRVTLLERAVDGDPLTIVAPEQTD